MGELYNLRPVVRSVRKLMTMDEFEAEWDYIMKKVETELGRQLVLAETEIVWLAYCHGKEKERGES